MLNLAKTSPLDLAAQLTPLSTAYEQWITEQEQLLLTTTDHNTIAQQRVGQALQPHRHNLRRLRQGIELLRTKPDAAQAFIFMNRAMGIYSHRTRFVEEYKRNNRCDPEHFNQPEYRRWLPLQLSFILINISALSIIPHIERSRDALADLLCYTDGQQKTATYLGLAAYTLGIRLQQRVIEQRSSQEGVAVILRYAHLHDVAIQLQHATTLICACEIVRRGSPHQWGTTPLRSGLWLTQNPQDQHTHLDNLLPLTNCPWCGTVLRQEQDVITEPFETGRGRTLIYCSNNKTPCPFSRVKAPDEGLPLVTVEEEIYRLLPALLITVDAKLIQLIHNNETRRLFGEIDMYCERHGFHTSTHQDPREASQHPRQGKFPAARSFPTRKLRPPDLIIYDEIVSSTSTNTEQTPSVSNEAMLDHLTTWNNRGALVRPKVIVATANMQPPTFALQVQLRRAINLFPPHGYNEQDTFFTRQQHLSMEQPGQLHLGIPVIGQSKKSVIRRVYLTLLAATQALYEQYREQADPWMTLVSYLHSTNDIAILQQLVEYDVSRDLAQMAQHGLTVRHRPLVRELTTQSSILDIQRILNNLEQSFGSDSREKPIDVLLADNAITVCHAIKRLNLLVIVEAPHTPTKDQLITSSIGNTVPGLICTIYDYAHPHKKA
jgi:hypothetical protein